MYRGKGGGGTFPKLEQCFVLLYLHLKEWSRSCCEKVYGISEFRLENYFPFGLESECNLITKNLAFPFPSDDLKVEGINWHERAVER